MYINEASRAHRPYFATFHILLRRHALSHSNAAIEGIFASHVTFGARPRRLLPPRPTRQALGAAAYQTFDMVGKITPAKFRLLHDLGSLYHNARPRRTIWAHHVELHCSLTFRSNLVGSSCSQPRTRDASSTSSVCAAGGTSAL